MASFMLCVKQGSSKFTVKGGNSYSDGGHPKFQVPSWHHADQPEGLRKTQRRDQRSMEQ